MVGSRAATTTRTPGPSPSIRLTSRPRYLKRRSTLGLLTKRIQDRPLLISMARRTVRTRPLLVESRQGESRLFTRPKWTLPVAWTTAPLALPKRLLMTLRNTPPGLSSRRVPKVVLGLLSRSMVTTWPLTPIRQLRHPCRSRKSR